MPYISKFFIDKIHEEADLVNIINDYLPQPLKKAGSVLKASSPWNDDKTASFTVSPSKGIWKDFSSGRGGNNAISFVMEKTGCSFTEAIEAIAQKMNLEVQYDDTKEAKKYFEYEAKKEALRPLLQAVINQYHKQFLALPADHEAKLEVFEKRQYTQEIVEQYQIGYAGNNKLIYNLCIANGKKEDAEALGLINEYGDRFKNRVIYPIIQKKGTTEYAVGLAGRDISNNPKSAKWINSSDSILYKKDRVWFGLDHARDNIVKLNEVWLMEGYNDVIAWQTNGFLNTVAGCGTAIGKPQIALLKKLCDKVIICMDPDKAGIRAMLKYIPELLEAGFRVETLLLPDCDPDDFLRIYEPYLKREPKFLTNDLKSFAEDGFKFLIDYNITPKKGVERSQNTKELCRTISNIEDDAIQAIYAEWLAKDSGSKIGQINKWIKEFVAKAEASEVKESVELVMNSDGYYQLPATIKEKIEDLRPIIEKYQMFMANNQIWLQTGTEPPFKFRSVSNFSIEIIQHMNDEKFPMKLVRICNVFKHEKIFDVPSEAFTSQQKFYISVSNNGNYLWKGSQNDLLKLSSLLFDKMGVGSKITELGWQTAGFWCWNNRVSIPGEASKEIDDNGVFKHKDVSYYIPSANKIYANSHTKYQPQKRLLYQYSDVTFLQYTKQMYKVHKGPAISSLLFTISAIFRDVIIDKNLKLPLIFLYGPPGTGKDELIYCCQHFYGIPQTSIQIGSKLSTGKAQVRKFAQFFNLIVHLSEYRPGNEQLDEIMKGFWDNNGYEVGNIESQYGTNTIPISSSVMFTGNHYPNDQALITRIIPEEMNQSEFTMEARGDFNKLQEMHNQGISHFTDELLQHRQHYKSQFKDTYKRVYKDLKAEITFVVPQDRMIQNIAVLCTSYELLKDKMSFPFSLTEIHAHFLSQLEKQCRKLNSNSLTVKFWDCFLASVNTQNEALVHGREFSVENDILYFNFTHCYNKISMKWWPQYHELAPSKGKLSEVLKDDECYINAKNSHRMEQSNSSVWCVDLTKTGIQEDLAEVLNWKNQQISDPFSPATHKKDNNTEKSDENNSQTDFPF